MRYLLIAALLLTACEQGAEMMAMKLTSPAFAHGESIPKKYTCDSEDINPPLHIEDAPAGTKSFVLIMDDPDAPRGTWDHWIVWNIPANTKDIAEDSVPGTVGRNSWPRNSYGGPCPPSGTHRYFFKLYALNQELNLPHNAGKKEVEQTMQGHILAQAELMGTYARS